MGIIEFYRVSKTYPGDVQALRELTFQIKEGEFVFITGPSGAGKSTLLRILLCIERVSEGQVLIQGRNIHKIRASSIPFLRRNIGFVFQDFKLLERRTVFDNVAIALEIFGLTKREISRRVLQMLDMMGLEKYRDHYPPMLSGGEQQRVAIARALVNEPTIILADEPTGNLDPDLSLEIMGLFAEINRRGTTFIIASHDQVLLERYSGRRLLLNKGFIVEDSLVSGGEA